MKSALILLSFFYYSVASAQVTVDQHPVSNKNWATFLQFIQNDPSLPKQYNQSMFPNQWGKAQTSNKHQDDPVTYVSWQQAQAYCEWRSLVATYLQTHVTLSTYRAMQMANRSAKTLIIYRLPSESEWEKLASRFTSKAGLGTGFRCVRSVKKAA